MLQKRLLCFALCSSPLLQEQKNSLERLRRRYIVQCVGTNADVVELKEDLRAYGQEEAYFALLTPPNVAWELILEEFGRGRAGPMTLLIYG